MFQGIDLYSDTMTRPTAAMKRAMVDAPLGDEQNGEDPTTLKLEARMAELLGKEAALFFPTATMANQIAILLHCERGDELIAAENAHIFFAEAGGPAVWANVLARPIPVENGIFTGAQVRSKFNTFQGPNFPVSRLVVVENTTNLGGGFAWNRAQLQDVWDACADLKLKCHVDGSRFFNAVVATGETPAALAKGFDTITICLSKGLGCPMGAVLCFPEKDWERVRRWKQCMGGALRQSGMLAAAGLYALDNHVARIAEDHANAKRLAEGLFELPGIQVESRNPSTNMVFFNLHARSFGPEQFDEACQRQGFRFSRFGDLRFRAVTHLDVTASDVDRVIQGVRDVVTSM